MAATRIRIGETCRSFDPDRLELPVRQNPLGLEGLKDRSFAIIAEMKSGSPSLGRIRDPLSFEGRLAAYEDGGAAAISVVTEKDFFFGGIERLDMARELTKRPILRKDFVIHPAMVVEAYAHGADWVLLMAAILTDGELEQLMTWCRSLGMIPLVEVHDRVELERVLARNPEFLGINNRDLRDFSVSLDRCLELKSLIPEQIPVIAESGIRSRPDIDRLRQAGFAGALVGEALMRQPDPDRLLREWLS